MTCSRITEHNHVEKKEGLIFVLVLCFSCYQNASFDLHLHKTTFLLRLIKSLEQNHLMIRNTKVGAVLVKPKNKMKSFSAVSCDFVSFNTQIKCCD